MAVILQRLPEGLIFIEQADHARLAADLARAWGTDAVPRIEPWDLFVRAVQRHDDGWIEYDSAPDLDDEGIPYDFIRIPAATRVEIYQGGIERVNDEELYSRLLISMHLTGLFMGRYEPDAQKGIDSAGEARARVERFVDEEEGWQDEVSQRFDPAGVWTHYHYLQLFDRVSLSVCMNPIGSIESTTLVSADERVPEIRLSTDGAKIRLEPNPFSQPVEVTLRSRRLGKTHFASSQELSQALEAAPIEERALSFG